MSRASNKSLLLLSMVHGAVKLLIDSGYLEDLNIADTLKYSDTLSEKVIHDFDASGNEKKNMQWMMKHLAIWKEMIDEPSIDWPPVVLVTMAGNIMEDLTSVLKNKKKLELINPLTGSIQVLQGYIEADSMEEEHELMSLSSELLYKMYNLIEFYP